MPINRSNVGVVAVGNKIYVVGGVDHNGRLLSIVEVLDVDTGVWSVLPSMVRARCVSWISVVEDNFIIVSGGLDDRLAEVFDIERGEWIGDIGTSNFQV